jgi:ribosomal subunit interface protein
LEIKINTGNNVEGKQSLETYMTDLINKDLARFDTFITRTEVHLSDENGNKKGPKDKKCVIECRMKGMDPVAVTSQEDTIRKAVDAAIDKMKAKLTSIVGKLREH